MLAVITGTSIGVGLHRGLNTYKRALRGLDPSLYDRLGIDSFCRRGLRAMWITISCFLLMMAVFILGLMRLRWLVP